MVTARLEFACIQLVIASYEFVNERFPFSVDDVPFFIPGSAHILPLKSFVPLSASPSGFAYCYFTPFAAKLCRRVRAIPRCAARGTARH